MPGDCRAASPNLAGWRRSTLAGVSCRPPRRLNSQQGEQAVSFAVWALIVGAMMITTALAGSVLKRLPLSASMLYLAAGYGVGMAGLWPLMPDPADYAAILERVSEVALLISLFSVGLKLGLPLWGRQWNLPLRLALLAMLVTVALVAAIGYLALGLPLGAAIVLGGILAPTDPVLASDVQVDDPADRDRLRCSLTGEGGLNDGAAFPFVMLGLGLLGLHDLGTGAWRWLAVDFLWALAGGLLIGIALGTIVGKMVFYLRTSHSEAVGLDEFVALGLIALAYGTAQLASASGFLAVFAAGLALQRIRKAPLGQTEVKEIKAGPAGLQKKEDHIAVATHPELAGAYLTQAARDFTGQLERIAELLIVLVVGFMLPYTRFDIPTSAFVAGLLLVVRPLSVWLGLAGATVARDQRLMISWFGIRGIGSIYYLMFALSHGLAGAAADQVLTLTLTTIAVSIVVHGVSVTPLMDFYVRRQSRRAARRARRPDRGGPL
jgi:NhaP-type Na+/H+ or K+/H+ antiporter